MNQQNIIALKKKLSGEVVTPSDTAYDELRSVFTRTGSPALIVRCHDNADVATAIQFARDNQLTLSVRSGGHGFSGLGTNNGGLVIDLSHFNTVDVIDASRNIVRIGAGARWGEAAKALADHGLAISSGDTNSVGVGGLTLGGGIGWMVRKYGLTIDSLVAADVVLADGRSLRVSEREYPDLFWAIRGGGGNFGVLTSFDFCAHPVQNILGGMVIYSVAEIESVLMGWSTAMRAAPDELSSTLIIFPGFGPEPAPMLMVLLCYAGDDALAEQAIQPLRELGVVQHEDIQKKPYYKMLEDAVPPSGLKSMAQNGFLKTISKDTVEMLVANYGRVETPIIQIRSLGGAVGRVHADATAFAHRDYEAFVLCASLVPADMPNEDAERVLRESWQPLKAFATGGYINFLTDVSEASVAVAYPSTTYARLAAVKAAYDPQNVFSQNANIKPAKSG